MLSESIRFASTVAAASEVFCNHVLPSEREDAPKTDSCLLYWREKKNEDGTFVCISRRKLHFTVETIGILVSDEDL